MRFSRSIIFELAFFNFFALHLLSFHIFGVFGVLPSGADKFALEVVDITFTVEKVLLLVTLDLNSAQTFLGQILC